MAKPWQLIIAALLLVGFAVAGVRCLRQDLAGILPQDDPKVVREAAFFTTQGTARILVVEAAARAGAGYPDVRAALLDLIPRLAPLGARPPAAGSPEAVAKAAETVYAHLPELTTSETLAALATEVQPAALVTRLAAIKQRSSRPDDLFTASAARRDPLALGAKPLAEMGGPAGATADGPLFRHVDGQHVMLLLEVDFAPDDVRRAGQLVDTVAAFHPPGVDLVLIGPYRHYVENTRTIWSDLINTLPICLVLVALILRSQLGTWRTVLVVHMPALVGMIGGLAGAGAWSLLTGSTMPLALVGFADGFLGIAVDYGNHVAAAKRAGHRPVMPLVISYLTTAAAFGVLLTSTIPALQFLAAMVIAGLGTALAVTLFVMPALLPPPGGRDRWLVVSGPLHRWCSRHPLRRLALAATLTVIALPGLWRLGFEQDLRRYDGSAPQTWRDLQAFTERWSGGVGGGASLVASAPALDAALTAVAAARQMLGLPLAMVERLLPSQAEQQRRRQAWNDFWRAHATFAEDLRAACVQVGMRPAAFASALSAYAPVADDRPACTLADWQGTPVATALDLQVTRSTDGGWQVASPIAKATLPEVTVWNAQLASAELTGGPVWIAHRGDFGTRILAGVRDDLAKRGWWVVGVVVLIVAIMLRRPRTCLAVILPPGIALIWTFGLLGWCGLPLTPFSLLAAAFILGIGIDSAVFLADGDESAFSPVLAVWVTTVVGVGSMAMSVHPVLVAIGISLTVGMTAAFIASILITPGVMGLARRPAE